VLHVAVDLVDALSQLGQHVPGRHAVHRVAAVPMGPVPLLHHLLLVL
jgi:hypothetical protein